MISVRDTVALVTKAVKLALCSLDCRLPLPWLLFTMVNGPVPVQSHGMACSILLLFGMLVAVVIGIACSRWRMSKMLGITMFLLYFVFVIVSLLLESKKLPCFT